MKHWITDNKGTCSRCGETGIFGVDEDSVCSGLKVSRIVTDRELIQDLTCILNDKLTVIEHRLTVLEQATSRWERFRKWMHTPIFRDPNEPDLALLKAVALEARAASEQSQKVVEASLDAARQQVASALAGIAKSSSAAAAEIENKLYKKPCEVGPGLWQVPGSTSIFHSWEEANQSLCPPEPDAKEPKRFKIIK